LRRLLHGSRSETSVSSPVLSDGRLVGMLQRHDIARWPELAWGPITEVGLDRGPRVNADLAARCSFGAPMATNRMRDGSDRVVGSAAEVN
jgi:hypothetical protein